MSGDDNIGVQHRSEREGSMRNCPTSDMPTNLMPEKVAGMAMTSLPMLKSSNGTDPFFVWDPLVSLSQSATFCGGTSMVPELSNHPYSLGNHGISSTSHLVQYPSESAMVEMVPKMTGFGSGSFSEMVGSFRLTECGQVPNGECLPIYPSDEARGTSSGGARSQEDCQVSDERAMGASACVKRRKRGVPDNSNSPLNPNKSPDGEQQRGPFGESSELQQQNDKKQKVEQDGLGARDTYVHVRAKRGQATNSHSLAERVRREKISERMKMLQELVPGCNKITGKAVMLDEIINYVQSLQQQVEFLSMKLATVNPDVNIDIERLLSKDILHSRVSDASILGYGPGMNSAHRYPHGISHGTLPHPMPGTSQLHSMPHQVVWDGEFQNVFQMGYDSNHVNNTTGTNGRPKSEI